MSMEFEVRVDYCVIRLTGRFTIGTHSEYLCARNELRHNGIPPAVIDCRELQYLDSTGLSFLVELHKLLGGHMALACVNARVREILQLTRLDGVIRAYPDVDSAAAALRVPALATAV